MLEGVIGRHHVTEKMERTLVAPIFNHGPFVWKFVSWNEVRLLVAGSSSWSIRVDWNKRGHITWLKQNMKIEVNHVLMDIGLCLMKFGYYV